MDSNVPDGSLENDQNKLFTSLVIHTCSFAGLLENLSKVPPLHLKDKFAPGFQCYIIRPVDKSGGQLSE